MTTYTIEINELQLQILTSMMGTLGMEEDINVFAAELCSNVDPELYNGDVDSLVEEANLLLNMLEAVPEDEQQDPGTIHAFHL